MFLQLSSMRSYSQDSVETEEENFSDFSDKEVIYWEQNVKLKWSDFQAEPDSLETYVGLATAATTAQIRIEIDWEGNLPVFRVINRFIKTKSWVKDSLEAGEYGLAHEQLHFDIAEIYARKIRKGITELRAAQNTNINDYEQLIDKLLTERDQYNTLYDKQTAHSMIDFRQQEWQDKIAQELKKNQEYKSVAPPVKHAKSSLH